MAREPALFVPLATLQDLNGTQGKGSALYVKTD